MPPDFPTALPVRLRKVGSNVRGRGLAAFQAANAEAMRAALVQSRTQLQRQARKLVSAAAIREAVALTHKFREEWNRSNFRLGPKASAWRKHKRQRGQQASAAFAKTIRATRQLRALDAVAERDFAAVTQRQFSPSLAGPTSLVFGSALSPVATAQVFKAPFPLFDVSESNIYPNRRNDSFALPRIGHVINNLHVSLSEHTSVANGIFGLDGVAFVFNRAGCGFNFTMPRRGRLRIVAELEHLMTRIRLRLSDNFGLSSGRVTGSSHIFVNIIRGRDIVEMKQTMVFDGLISHGDDLFMELPAPDIGTRFTFDTTTDAVFEAGAALQIIAGCEFSSGATLDDMEAIADALIWHDLRQVSVDVV